MDTPSSSSTDRPYTKTDNTSRSDLSSSPSLTFTSSSESQSNPHTPPTPRTPARYPSNLSVTTGGKRPPRSNVSPKSGKPYEYQSLEDLLRDNGYRETRIFTPESERTTPAPDQAAFPEARASPLRIDLKASDDEGGTGSDCAPSSTVGGKVVNLLSAWMPSRSVTAGRVKAVEAREGMPPSAPTSKDSEAEQAARVRSPTFNVAVEPPFAVRGSDRAASSFMPGMDVPRVRGSRVPRTALTDALESALRKAQHPHLSQPGPSRTSSLSSAAARSLQRRIHTGSPAQSLTPSSSTSTIRPSPRQVLHQQRQQSHVSATHTDEEPGAHGLEPPRPNLRHTASAPAVGKSKSAPANPKAGIRPSRRPLASEENEPKQETWLESITSILANAAAGSKSRENLHPLNDDTTTRRPRSAASRTGRRPNVVVTQHFRPAPATAVVSEIQADAVVCRSAPSSRSASRVRQPKAKHASGKGRLVEDTPMLSPSLDGKDDDPMSAIPGDDAEDEDSDADTPNLETILSTCLKRHHRHAKQSSASSESDSEEPVARRQRSIRSLRAHLTAHQVTPGVNGVPPLPLPFGKAKSLTAHSSTTSPVTDLSAWLDGDDWQERGTKKSRKGLFPQWLTPPEENRGRR